MDMDRLRTEIIRLAPEDKDLIDTLVRHMEAFGRIDVPLDVGIRRMLPALGFTRLFKKYPMTGQVLAMRLSNPRMR